MAIQDAAVTEIGTAGKNKEGTGGSPGLFEQGGFGQGVDGIVGAEKAAEGVEAVADGLEG